MERTKVENYIYIIAQNSINIDEKADFYDETEILPDKMQRQNYQTERYAISGAREGRCEKLAKIGGKGIMGALTLDGSDGGAALDGSDG